jgi:hypothetical protein
MIWQIAPLDADTAYAAVTVPSPSNSKGIYKTTNGGSTWRKLNVYGSSYYGPSFVWFFDAMNGVAVGDPNLETYTTTDGGEHWNQVIMYPYANEYTWMPARSVGNCAWFATYNGSRVFGTTDKGNTWFASPREPQYGDWYPALAFQDSSTGIYTQKKVENITPFQYRRTTDGGTTWSYLSSAVLDIIAPTDISYIPGTHSTYLVAGGMQLGKRGLARTIDAGESWTLIDTIGAVFLGFASDSVGWCVPHEHSHLVYKYVGPRITTTAEEQFFYFPRTILLEQNYPNPFNPSTTIKYEIPEISLVSIKVYDVLGSEVVTLIDEEQTVGSYEVKFNATELPSGIYFYQLRAGSFVETKKMILMK